MNSWLKIIPLILQKPAHVDVIIPSHQVVEPTKEGFRETLGDIQGQKKDYELTLQDGRRIHVTEFEKSYKAHWDRFSPLVNVVGHMRYDAPHWWIFACLLGGASIGALGARDRVAGAVVGGTIGTLVGFLSLP
jgi:hypothetical protein